MEGYELGKDIQEMKDSLKRLEDKIQWIDTYRESLTRTRCPKRITDVSVVEDGLEEVEREGQTVSLKFKYVRWNHNQDEECYWRKHISKVYEDGTIEDDAELYNSSSVLDPQGGDYHNTWITVISGPDDIYTWSWTNFVAGGKPDNEHFCSFSDVLKANYGKITDMSRDISCT